eukprot:CAMPEP_0181210116 /NCGR_PEP_ID=MMETSP1096-20121128/23049_1 /TAXON_ID=156174 ORGANISM="Chrysochromulina ericina, Strain CCMP281" /NCGR_SAMPLE_ID=MMETSP1096 /ASSEMBLY_ACC=CAM_ASM_000453 /LENGTH=249 /DNA_ID=CAMNT_0023301365 /DNA_START=14 /DNA_END=763 /DNA_ORIENTATION=+
MSTPAPSMEEDALIEAVIRLRLTGCDSVPKLHAALEGEGEAVTLSQVKKAASKATKRTGTSAPASAPAGIEPAKPISEAKLAKQEKVRLKEEKQKNAEVKGAENDMMEKHRLLKAAKSGDRDAAVTITGTAEEFIQQISKRAISGVLEAGEESYLKERIEADIATLEWIKIASAAGALSLSEDVVALGSEIQLARLKEVRGGKDLAAARACYVREPGAEDGEYTNVDRMLARSGGMAPEGTGDKMEEMD